MRNLVKLTLAAIATAGVTATGVTVASAAPAAVSV